MPWIIDDVSDKVESALGTSHLTSLKFNNLNCKSWVANEFLDLMCSYDIPEQGLEKLRLHFFIKSVEPLEEEVLTRIATMCTNLANLKLRDMYNLSEAGRLSMVSLVRQIVQSNPPITVFSMHNFSQDKDRDVNIGELVLEILLSSNIDSITDLDISFNDSWFKNPSTGEERSGNVDLLVELIAKQAGLQKINLRDNHFSYTAI